MAERKGRKLTFLKDAFAFFQFFQIYSLGWYGYSLRYFPYFNFFVISKGEECIGAVRMPLDVKDLFRLHYNFNEGDLFRLIFKEHIWLHNHQCYCILESL